MTTVTAGQRRRILANIHARFYCTHPNERTALMEANMRELGNVIPAETKVLEITTEGDTTVLVKLSNGEGLLLDAYGNLQRGML